MLAHDPNTKLMIRAWEDEWKMKGTEKKYWKKKDSSKQNARKDEKLAEKRRQKRNG